MSGLESLAFAAFLLGISSAIWLRFKKSRRQAS